MTLKEGLMSLHIIPLTLREANKVVTQWHRHHKPVIGQKFAIGAYCSKTQALIGAAITSRPVARGCDYTTTLEVSRLVTNGTPNACSFLYSACARIAREMGYKKIQTYILDTEPGVSLKASGWVYEATTAGGTWNCKARTGRREDQPLQPKQRWSKTF